jgi:hypothetical protein
MTTRRSFDCAVRRLRELPFDYAQGQDDRISAGGKEQTTAGTSGSWDDYFPTFATAKDGAPGVHPHQDAWLYSMCRAHASSHEREIDFHVSLK